MPRLADRYDPLALHEKLSAALEALGGDVPAYFRLLGRDLLIEHGLSEGGRLHDAVLLVGGDDASLNIPPLSQPMRVGWMAKKLCRYSLTRAPSAGLT